MSIKGLHSYDIELLLPYLPLSTVVTFGEAFPTHIETVESYWKCKSSINFDTILSRDIAACLGKFDLLQNLKEVYFTVERNSPLFITIPNVLASHRPPLEVLNICGMELTNETLALLSIFNTLKSLTIRLNRNTDPELLNKLILNNPNLEDVCLDGDFKNTCFEKLPKSIKKFEIRNNIDEESKNVLMRNIETWQLEKLCIPAVALGTVHLAILSKHTTLKILNMGLSSDVNDLIAVFSNNSQLEDVSLQSKDVDKSLDANILRTLPPTLQHLKVFGRWAFCENILNSFKIWNLKTFHFRIYRPGLDSYCKFLPGLVKVSDQLEHLSLDCYKFQSAELMNISEFKQLKSLYLMWLNAGTIDVVKHITQHCVNLEEVTLVWEQRNKATEDLFESLASLSKLKELTMVYLTNLDKMKNFTALSKSPSLTKASFYCGSGVDDEAALLLIKGCKTLTHFTIRDPWITQNVVTETVKFLNTQKDRTEILNLRTYFHDAEDMAGKDHHPLLELEICSPIAGRQIFAARCT